MSHSLRPATSPEAGTPLSPNKIGVLQEKEEGKRLHCGPGQPATGSLLLKPLVRAQGMVAGGLPGKCAFLPVLWDLLTFSSNKHFIFYFETMTHSQKSWEYGAESYLFSETFENKLQT